MATPADQRLLELLEKWLKSLELHTKYSSLDDDSYWKIQPWVEHQRPARWILDLARQKTLALRAQVEGRVKTGDTQFSDSLELMIFLANLVGSEHIERFIPVAEPDNERSLSPAAPDLSAAAAEDTQVNPATAATATREMPKFIVAKPRTPPPASTAQVARTERKPAAAGKPAAKLPAKPAAAAKTSATAKPSAKIPPEAAPDTPSGNSGTTEGSGSSEAAREQVIADAVRLVQWGRKWFELAELIARMADRPPLPVVRRILKENKSAIDEKAGSA